MGEFLPVPGEAAEILVVSLESAEARRAAFAARAAETSLAWRFFDACTAPAPGMMIDEAAIRRNKGRAMSKGEIGCYASHFSIWQDMVDRGVRQAIVLEDDTVVDWAYLEPLARAAKAARRASALSSDTTNISAASPDSGRNSPTDIRLLFTAAAKPARCKTGGPPDAILGSGQLFESEGARAPVVRSTGRLVFAGAAYG